MKDKPQTVYKAKMSWIKYTISRSSRRAYTMKEVHSILEPLGYTIQNQAPATKIDFIILTGTKNQILEHRKKITDALKFSACNARFDMVE